MKQPTVPTHIKLLRADRHASQKGFRPGYVYKIVGTDFEANPQRGPLLMCRSTRTGRVEGFYPDECRIRRRAPLDRMLAGLRESAPWLVITQP